MGEAYLCQKGGNTFRGLKVLSAPVKTEYFSGEYADLTGMVIGADFGTFVVPISGYSYTPIEALATSDTEIVVTATVGRQTKSVGIPITVSPISLTFGDNPWEAIAYIAALGQAGEYWSVGDSKADGGITYTIIGMNHDDLSPTDAKYSDAAYNGGSKKAALTIQIMTAAGPGKINLTDTSIGGWDACYMRSTILPAYLDDMPQSIRDLMRTVDKKTSRGVYEDYTITTSRDRLFLLGGSEIYTFDERDQLVLGNEGVVSPQYQYYAEGRARYKGMDEWTRSPLNTHYNTQSRSFVCVPQTISWANGQSVATAEKYYFPAFCI